MLFHQGVGSSGTPAHGHAPLTHGSILVDQQVGVKEVVYEVRQPIALTWEEEKSKALFPWHVVHGPAQLGEAQGDAHGGPGLPLGIAMARGSPEVRAKRRTESTMWSPAEAGWGAASLRRPFFF